MLLLTQDKRIVNLDCMAIIDTASLQVLQGRMRMDVELLLVSTIQKKGVNTFLVIFSPVIAVMAVRMFM